MFLKGGQSEDQIEDAGTGYEVAETPLEGGYRRDRFGKNAVDGCGFRCVRGRGAIAVGNDHANVHRLQSGFGESEFDGAAETETVRPHIDDTGGFVDRPRAEQLADDR